jgi:hypothetical protein
MWTNLSKYDQDKKEPDEFNNGFDKNKELGEFK